jgi:single-strand DNA-binding protein
VRNSTPITVVGNLTDAPELRFTPSGAAVARFTVAHNPRYYDKTSDTWKDGEPSFYRCTAWRGLAENIAESLPRGARVVLAGEIRQRTWKDDKTGETRSSWDVTVEAIGPELTYAQATVRKMSRTARGETAPDDPWTSASREPVPAGVGANEEPPF